MNFWKPRISKGFRGDEIHRSRRNFEFRKRVQFMYGGRLEHIRFRYTGPSLEAVLDRLPTAQVLSQAETGWLISAEVFGKGIEMWLRSQGEWVERV